MEWYYILLIVACAALLLVFVTTLICFLIVFYSPKRPPFSADKYDIPPGKPYEKYRDGLIEWIKTVRAMPCEEITITSHDGLRLVGYYYEHKPGAVTEIILHGYRGNADRDLPGGVLRCFSLGRNALVVDQRAAGRSEGRVITFGIKERRDLKAWTEYAYDRFGADIPLIITGVSMGAATVLMAASDELAPSVCSVVADCGYTSAKDIIYKVMKEDMHLPPKLLYPFVRLGARLFGGFDTEEFSPIESVKKSRRPIIFIHGDADGFVPCEMSVRMYEECNSRKRLWIAAGAAHGLAYPSDKEGYERELREFFELSTK